MNKRGIEMSFSVIFSIIIIIAIIGVSFYVIKNFLGLQKCTEQSLFYDDFQDEIDKIWNSEISKTTYVGDLPSGVQRICFKSLGEPNDRYREEYNKIERYFRFDANMFLYPPEKACEPAYLRLEHVDLSSLAGFDCIEVQNGKANIRLEKDSFDPLVRVGRP